MSFYQSVGPFQHGLHMQVAIACEVDRRRNCLKTVILSWLQNDGTREFSKDQLKGKQLLLTFWSDALVVFRAKVKTTLALKTTRASGRNVSESCFPLNWSLMFYSTWRPFQKEPWDLWDTTRDVPNNTTIIVTATVCSSCSLPSSASTTSSSPINGVQTDLLYDGLWLHSSSHSCRCLH